MANSMTDIILDISNDLELASGDWLSMPATAQHQRLLLLCNKGDFKQHPTIGVGVFTYFDDEQFQQLIRAVSIEFTRDGMQVDSIYLDADGVLRSEASYL
ncbi:MAG: hypothetical protein EBZ77_11825 [Chitinophagia bacterium]|nr:hypothetical protein [Chitinophagia bacterium]